MSEEDKVIPKLKGIIVEDINKPDTSMFFNKSPKHDDIEHYVSMMTSASHTYGNVLAFIINWVLDYFPKNTFKTIHTSTKIAHRQLKNIEHEFVKKSKPMIIFRPRIADFEEDRFLKGTAFIEKQTGLFSSWGGGCLQDFIIDKKHNYRLSYQLNRSVINIDVVLIFETFMQQQDYIAYMNNSFTVNHPTMLNTILESYIPEEMLSIISNLSGIPVYDEQGCTYDFFRYFNSLATHNPITYKLQPSTGRKEFFRYYPAEIMTTVGSISGDDGDKQGQVTSNYQISFSIRLEFNSTGLYYIFSNKVDEDFSAELRRNHEEFLKEGINSSIIPSYVDIISKEDLMLPIGWNIYERASCMLDKVQDNVNINSMLNESLRRTLEYHLKNGLPLSPFFDIRIRRQGTLLIAGKDYMFDPKTTTIYFNNKSTAYSYAIAIVVNIEYVNDMIKSVYNLD